MNCEPRVEPGICNQRQRRWEPSRSLPDPALCLPLHETTFSRPAAISVRNVVPHKTLSSGAQTKPVCVCMREASGKEKLRVSVTEKSKQSQVQREGEGRGRKV